MNPVAEGVVLRSSLHSYLLRFDNYRLRRHCQRERSVSSKQWFVLGSLLSLPILFQVAPASIEGGFVFSRTALELAFAYGMVLLSFPVLYPAIITLLATIVNGNILYIAPIRSFLLGVS